MRSLLIATTNPAKFEEASVMFANTDFKILGLHDFSAITTIEETGATFEENAMLKAKGYFEQTLMPCIADDGGLMIDYLDGAPGVHSKRWIQGQDGHEATDQELALAVLKKMQDVPQKKRIARLGGVVVFWDGIHLIKQENWIEGYIAERLMGEIKKGFPYRPLLMVPQFNKPYSELTEEEHRQVNFRRKNLEILKPKILELLM